MATMETKEAFKEWANALSNEEKFQLLYNCQPMRLTDYEYFAEMESIDEYFDKPSDALSRIKDECNFSYEDDVFAIDIMGALYSFDMATFLDVNFDAEQLADNWVGIHKLDYDEGELTSPWSVKFFDWCDDNEIVLGTYVCSMKPEFDLHVLEFEVGAAGFIYDYKDACWSRAIIIGCAEKEKFQKHSSTDYRGEFVVKQDDGSFKQIMVEMLTTNDDPIGIPNIVPTHFC